MRILILCSGNTCRSPMAEYLLRQKFTDAGLDDVVVTSAGTGAREGSPPSEGAYLVSLERGLDLTNHRSRLVSPELLAAADLVLCMSQHHVTHAQAMGTHPAISLLGAFADPDSPAEVSDPFGKDLETYRNTLAQLDGLLTAVVRKLKVSGGSPGSD